MAIVIESEIWQPNAFIYAFIFVACFVSISLLPHISNRSATASPFDLGYSFPSSFLRFQRNFLLLYSLSSVMEGLWSVIGEYETANYGLDRETMVLSLCAGFAASFFIGTFLGVLSDVIGQRKACLLFCILHLIVGLWKRLTTHPTVWVASICLSLASTIFSFGFETWMVLEHDKLGYRQDALNDTFWLMVFSESAALIGSQMLANWLAAIDAEKTVVSLSTVALCLGMINMISIARGWTESPERGGAKDYRISFSAYAVGGVHHAAMKNSTIKGGERISSLRDETFHFCAPMLALDRRIWLLSCAQACLHFSIGVFWILWAPTIVADGREVHLGLMYPCLMGARMLGSSLFPWFTSLLSSVQTEDYLLYAFIFAGLVLSVVAYDYQEIGVLLLLFCLFHGCAGLMLPSLARLRTMYVPNEFRARMMSISLAPAYAALLLVVFEGGYYRNLSNATITSFAALGHFVAAGCMYMLKRWGKQPHQNWHKL